MIEIETLIVMLVNAVLSIYMPLQVKNRICTGNPKNLIELICLSVGDIPQNIHGDQRSRISGRSSVKTALQEQRPMSRTVSRSASMSAPWNPRFKSEGYEIDYAQDEKNVSKSKF